ncbi:hypothetical protein [Paenibacillus koleovorans]|uniref:hypothetical protein n=1 Tax=Paenibacillus koleovorans TaxID=121608 RepID=UPI000FDB50BD|nr:hypothetical protein [Paenibacillus koleovorans]
MSRQWERMVRKNSKLANKRRAKSGQAVITATSGETMNIYKGRSWFLPSLLVAMSIFYAFTSLVYSESSTMMWVVTAAYVFLGLMYFLRRPYIKIGRKQVATRRLGVERFLSAEEMESITVQPGGVVIKLKAGNKRWVFTKFQNLYDIPAIAERMKTFAAQHQVPFQEEAAPEKKSKTS